MKERVLLPVQVLQEILDQLCQCNYTCEAGHIEKNVHFQTLAAFVNKTLAMEPIWEIAPEWAKYWAVDKDGDGYWYENEPSTGASAWYKSSGDTEQVCSLGGEVENWKDTLREREGSLRTVGSFALDWSSAPEWAKWWAEDEDGRHFWYAIKPVLHSDMWKVDGTTFELAGSSSTGVDWEISLTERPAGSATATFTPSWEDAPEWARYWAADLGGSSFWYKDAPKKISVGWLPRESAVPGEWQRAEVEVPEWLSWEDSLRERGVFIAKLTLVGVPIAAPWSEAPAWAQWFAQDEDGDCYWYRGEPSVGWCIWLPGAIVEGECEKLKTKLPENPDWKNTLQERPK
jgi:hypothetical protein